MTIQKYLNESYPTLEPEDTGEEALVAFGEFKLSHIPVIEEGRLKAILMEEDVLFHEPNKAIREYIHRKTAIKISSRSYFVDAIELMAQHGLSILPVVNQDKRYVGVIENIAILQALSQHFAIREQGAILVLEVMPKDYSLAEITNIIESEGVKILWSAVSPFPLREEKIKIHLKTNTNQLSTVGATLERYGYNIYDIFDEKSYSVDLKDRYESLMNYLNV